MHGGASSVNHTYLREEPNSNSNSNSNSINGLWRYIFLEGYQEHKNRFVNWCGGAIMRLTVCGRLMTELWRFLPVDLDDPEIVCDLLNFPFDIY